MAYQKQSLQAPLRPTRFARRITLSIAKFFFCPRWEPVRRLLYSTLLIISTDRSTILEPLASNCFTRHRPPNALIFFSWYTYCFLCLFLMQNWFFSALKRVRTSKWASLSQSPLENTLRIKLQGPPLEEYDPSEAVLAWHAGKARRQNQNTRKEYKKQATKHSPFTKDSSSDTKTNNDEAAAGELY